MKIVLLVLLCSTLILAIEDQKTTVTEKTVTEKSAEETEATSVVTSDSTTKDEKAKTETVRITFFFVLIADTLR